MTDEEINIYQAKTLNEEPKEGEHFRRIKGTIDGDENKDRLEESITIVKRLNLKTNRLSCWKSTKWKNTFI